MGKLKTVYRILEVGGFIYPPTGISYAENQIDSLADWAADDIAAALLKRMIETIGVEPITKEVLTDGENIGS